MSIFYSPSTGGFYHPEVHGSRTLSVPNPQWVRPTKKVKGEKEPQPDLDAEPDLIDVENPDCRIPGDAVEITEERHAELLHLQSEGKQIVATPEGHPDAVDPAPPTDEERWAAVRRKRNGLLAKTQHLVGGDYPQSPEDEAAWRVWRQFLRDIPATQTDPSNIDWGTPPAPVV